MKRFGWLLCGLLSGPVWGQSGPEMAAISQGAGASDPWAALVLADRLMTAKDRQDEAVAVLMGAVADADTAEEAKIRLRTLLLNAPPRAAWMPAYALAGSDHDERLALHAERAALQVKRTRAGALTRLETQLAQSPDDLALRRAVMEGLLHAGRPNNAMWVYAQGRGDASLRDLQVIALLSRARFEEARLLDASLVPKQCESDPAQCAPILASMGWTTSAGEGLRHLIENRSAWSRTRAERARLAQSLAEVERIRGRKGAEITAWAQAWEWTPKDGSIRLSYVNALLETGQVGRARGVLRSEDQALARRIQAVQTVSRVALDNTSQRTTDSLAKALKWAPGQSIVVRAWAHHQIVSGNAEVALAELEPLISDRVDPALTDLVVWAAGQAGQPERAIEILTLELSQTKRPDRWAHLVDKLAATLPVMAEAAKSGGEPRRALGLYVLARALAPDSTANLLGLGGSYWAIGDLDNALRSFEQARRQGPGNRQALFSLVSVLKTMEREEEAMQLLRESGYADYHTQLLELELIIALAARPAREALRADRFDEAIETYLELLKVHPNNPGLMHGLADTYIAARRYEEAVDAYALAQRVQPNNPWLRLGEANALVALGETVLASGVLERMGDPDDPRLLEAMFRTSLAIIRMEADLLARDGKSVAAFEKYRRLMDIDPGPETLGGLARLYMRHWQHDVAHAFFEEALDLDPEMADLQSGLVVVLMARERLQEAQERAAILVSTHPTPAHIQLAGEVERRRIIQRSIEAASNDRSVEAEQILKDLLKSWPDDPDGWVALSDLCLRQERFEEAYQHAVRVLAAQPAHAGALGAAQRAGLKLNRASELLTHYQRALELDPSQWVRDQIQAMELAVVLEEARIAHLMDDHERAVAMIETAQERFGVAEGRPWVMIGSAWLAISEPERALESFELAHELEHEDPGAVLGLSGTWWVLGRFELAESVLAEHWQLHQNLVLGAELARVQVNRGHRLEAQQTLSALMEAHANGADRPVPLPPEPLPILPLTSGRQPESRPNELAPAPLGPPRFPEVDMGGVRAYVYNPYRVTTHMGAGVATRPGDAGLQQLQMVSLPVAAEVLLPGSFRLNMELIGTSVENGQDQIMSISPSVALATSERGIFHSALRLGMQAPMGAAPQMTWSGLLRGRFEPGLSVELETVRAPVSGSYAAWAGDPSGDFGRIQDTWLGGRISMTPSLDRSIGMLGRAGVSDGNQLTAVPWSQAMGWFHWPLIEKPGRPWIPQLGMSAEGMWMTHDRQVGGFELEQAGMFSPEAYRSASGRILGRWTTPRERFGLCSVFGAGPQRVIGEPTLYLGPGRYLGYQAEFETYVELTEGWLLSAAFKHQGTRGEWHQNIGAVQLQRGRADSGMAAPSSAFASAVHGPPVSGGKACGPGWSEWGQ